MNIAQSTGVRLGFSVIRFYPVGVTAFISIFWRRICLEICNKVGLEMSSSAKLLRMTARVYMLNFPARYIDCFKRTSRQS